MRASHHDPPKVNNLQITTKLLANFIVHDKASKCDTLFCTRLLALNQFISVGAAYQYMLPPTLVLPRMAIYIE